MTLREIKREAFIDAFLKAGRNRTRTALHLDASLRFVRMKLNQYVKEEYWFMDEKELLKKKRSLKRTSAGDGKRTKKQFPTLARIVLNNGSVVDIPKLPFNISELTTYDNMRIALEHAALAICCLNSIRDRTTPILTLSITMEPIRMNLEDLMNHLYWAIESYHQSSEQS